MIDTCLIHAKASRGRFVVLPATPVIRVNWHLQGMGRLSCAGDRVSDVGSVKGEGGPTRRKPLPPAVRSPGHPIAGKKTGVAAGSETLFSGARAIRRTYGQDGSRRALKVRKKNQATLAGSVCWRWTFLHDKTSVPSATFRYAAALAPDIGIGGMRQTRRAGIDLAGIWRRLQRHHCGLPQVSSPEMWRDIFQERDTVVSLDETCGAASR